MKLRTLPCKIWSANGNITNSKHRRRERLVAREVLLHWRSGYTRGRGTVRHCFCFFPSPRPAFANPLCRRPCAGGGGGGWVVVGQKLVWTQPDEGGMRWKLRRLCVQAKLELASSGVPFINHLTSPVGPCPTHLATIRLVEAIRWKFRPLRLQPRLELACSKVPFVNHLSSHSLNPLRGSHL